MAVPLLHYEHAGRETGRYGLAHASIFPYRPYTCRDGNAVVVAIQQNGEWKRFCETVLQRADLLADERFASNVSRVADREALDREIEPIFATMDSAEAIRRLEAARIAWGRVSKVGDLPRHKALRRTEVSLPNGKQVAVPAPAGRPKGLGNVPAVPALGADTDRIRAEFAA
jgi:crotonobetainyl-CoA:carnitine CoA-transferase CaiB-like acyl-CoA transferase